MADTAETTNTAPPAAEGTTSVEDVNVDISTPAEDVPVSTQQEVVDDKAEKTEVETEKTEAETKETEPEPQKSTSEPSVDGIACKLVEAADYVTTDRSTPVKIRFGTEGVQATPAISVMEFLQRTVNRFPNRTALKVEREGKWISWTYQEYLNDVKTAAKAFIKLGLESYNGVGILGFNSPEWLFSDLGAIYAGGLATGIYTTNNPEACRYVCADAECNIVVVENEKQMSKILEVWDQLPKLKAIVQYIGDIADKKDNMYTWNEFMELGRAEDDAELNKRIESQAPNKCCTLIYTSGTTGNPKGVMLSHDNVIAACENVCQLLKPFVDVDANDPSNSEVAISYLPLSHIAAQMTDVWIPCRAGGCVWFARPDALKGSLSDTLKVARPTLFVAVPRVYEKIEEKLKGIGANVQGLKRKVADWAKGIALKGNRNKEHGKGVPYGWTLANGLVLKKVHKALGLDRAKMLFTAAAPISKQTLEYFQSLNLPLLELYGLSESSGAVTLSIPKRSRITSIGFLTPINEQNIINPDEDGSGELCFRGRNIFMGYLNNEEKTKEAIDDDGWLHTGDVGRADEDGFYYITGRIKELIITAGGENIAPVPIEDNIKAECPLIATAMVIGDKKKFLSCLLTCQVEIDQETGLYTDKLLPSAVHYCKGLGLEVTKAQEIAPDVPEALKKAIDAAIGKANEKAVSNASRVQKWKLLPLEFTTTGGELGPTQKLRRPQVMKMYKETIDEFYA